MTDTNQPTETNEVAFHEKVETPIGRTRAARVGIVAGAAFLFVVGAVAAMGASPAPSTGTDPAANPEPPALPNLPPTGPRVCRGRFTSRPSPAATSAGPAAPPWRTAEP